MSVCEWVIENFSCWNAEIHGDVIECEGERAQLYPRGEGGKGECLLPRIAPGFVKEGKGPLWFLELEGGQDLSFIASDGSVLCGPLKAEGQRRIFPPGPRFSEVVERNKEKDRLILRWTKKRGGQYKYYYYRSIICHHDASVELDSSFFRDLKIEDWTKVSMIESPQSLLCWVDACKSDTGIPKFKVMLPVKNYYEIKVLVQTTFSIRKADGVTKIFEEEFLLEGTEHRVFSFLRPEHNPNEKIFVTFKFMNGKTEQFQYSTDYPRTEEITNPSSSKSPTTVLAKELECLYLDCDFSDFELRCGTVSFPTHRNILCARSPVFKAMLTGDMREAGSGHMDVEDLDSDTLGRFLAFLYSGSTGGEAPGCEEAINLYYAADKYQVPSLKEECSALLCTSVSLENVCDILSLADKHQDEKLSFVARDFISKNYNQVLGSQNWEKFMSSDSLLAVKTLTYFAKTDYALKKV